jgi:hypothetical protein
MPSAGRFERYIDYPHPLGDETWKTQFLMLT